MSLQRFRNEDSTSDKEEKEEQEQPRWGSQLPSIGTIISNAKRGSIFQLEGKRGSIFQLEGKRGSIFQLEGKRGSIFQSNEYDDTKQGSIFQLFDDPYRFDETI